LWSFAMPGGVESSPAVANGVVYIGSDDGNVYAIDAANGQKLWSSATGSAVRSSPSVANGVVHFGSDNGKLYAASANGMPPPTANVARPDPLQLQPDTRLVRAD